MATPSSASAGCSPTSVPLRRGRSFRSPRSTALNLETEPPLMNARADFAATFRRLHHGPTLLVLANAWDAGSARLIESLGAPAVATTSAGVAWSHGYPDGDALPVRLL